MGLKREAYEYVRLMPRNIETIVEPIRLQDTEGSEINPATEDTLKLVLSKISEQLTKLDNILSRLDIALSDLRDSLKQEMKLVYSTETPLAANDSVDSGAISTQGYGKIVGTVYADVDGTLYVEQGNNGSNWDVVDSFTLTAGEGFGFSVEIVAPYVRIRYVNGASAQTTFRLYAYLKRY